MRTSFIAAIFLAILGFYVYSLYPACAPEDSGEYIAVCHTLGIAHAPGNPLYIILGKIFSLFPLGNIAYRINLLSSLLAIFSLVILFKIIKLITTNDFVSVTSVIIFSFTYEFWYTATFAKTFTLIFFLSLLCLFCLLLYLKDPQNLKYLYLSYYLVGLSLAGHYFLFMFVPLLFFITVLFVKDKIIKVFLISSLLFILGFSIHLFLPIRSYTKPLINSGKPDTIENLYNFLTRKEMSGFKMSNLADTPISKQEIFSKTKWFYNVLVDHFTFIWVLTGILGFFVLWKKDKKVFYPVLFLITLSGPVWLIFSAFSVTDPFKEAMNERYLPVFESLFAVLIGTALGFVIDYFGKNNIKRIILYVLMLFTGISPLLAHLTAVNKRDNFLCDDYCLNFFRTTKPNSTVFVGQHLDSIGRYMKYVRKKRNDLVFVISPDKFNSVLEGAKNTSAPVYADPSCRLYFSNLFRSYPLGLVFKCNPLDIYDYNEYERPWLFYSYRNIGKSGDYKDFFSQMVLMWYTEAYDLFGDTSLSYRKKQQAIGSLKKCISIGMYEQDLLNLRTYNYRSITPKSSFMYNKVRELNASL